MTCAAYAAGLRAVLDSRLRGNDGEERGQLVNGYAFLCTNNPAKQGPRLSMTRRSLFV